MPLTISTIRIVQSIENDYGSVMKVPKNDVRLRMLHDRFPSDSKGGNPKSVSNERLNKAQQLLDKGMPKYKITEIVGISRRHLGQLCEEKLLDDSKWYVNRTNIHRYEYYCNGKLLARGTIKEISGITGRSRDAIRGCTLSRYSKYHHENEYKLVTLK